MKTKYLILITTLTVLVLGCNKNSSSKIETSDHVSSTENSAPTEWSKDQMDTFWQKINPMLQQTLYMGKWHYQELGNHMLEVATLCKERYGAYPVVIANYNSMKKSRGIVATPMIVSGKPQVMLFLPALLDLELLYNEGNIPDNENQLYDAVATIILHEEEHLAYGYLAQENTLESSVNAESKTWAITCEKVLKTLVQHDRYLTGSAAAAYQKWIDCGRNADNPEWIEWISQTVANPK